MCDVVMLHDVERESGDGNVVGGTSGAICGVSCMQTINFFRSGDSTSEIGSFSLIDWTTTSSPVDYLAYRILQSQ